MFFNAPHIIVALDFNNLEDAVSLARQLSPELCRLKVGKELFVTAGPAIVEQLIKMKYEVFLDLKFHDIPNTVAKACIAAANLGVWMLNVHASGGSEMMMAAYDAITKFSSKPWLIAVTVLTSMDENDLKKLGVSRSVSDQALYLAKLAKEAKLDGVVCSAHETQTFKEYFGHDFCLVTPGIRLPENAGDDQKRTMTPAQALAAGSDYLVIGRPITQAENPCKVLKNILNRVV